jgi:hypothetical protein
MIQISKPKQVFMQNLSLPNPKKYLWIIAFLFSINFTFSQDRIENISVSGKVSATDSKEGIPSVSIKIKGTNKGTNSDANGNYITMNAKDDTIKLPGFTKPEKFTKEVYDQLDNVIVSILGKQKLIIPDDIRGSFITLEEAVLKKGWLKMSKAKGKFLFVLDEGKSKTDEYIQNHPSLKGRVLFTNSPIGNPEAAFLIMNNAIKDLEKIKENVKKGYIVRTRSDSDTREARTNDYRSFEAAKASGAQIISTDYYLRSTLFSSNYSVSFDGKVYFRKNPLF